MPDPTDRIKKQQMCRTHFASYPSVDISNRLNEALHHALFQTDKIQRSRTNEKRKKKKKRKKEGGGRTERERDEGRSDPGPSTFTPYLVQSSIEGDQSSPKGLTQQNRQSKFHLTKTNSPLPLTTLRPGQLNKTHTNSSAQISIQKYQSLYLYPQTPIPRNPPNPPRPPKRTVSRNIHVVISIYTPFSPHPLERQNRKQSLPEKKPGSSIQAPGNEKNSARKSTRSPRELFDQPNFHKSTLYPHRKALGKIFLSRVTLLFAQSMRSTRCFPFRKPPPPPQKKKLLYPLAKEEVRKRTKSTDKASQQ